MLLFDAWGFFPRRCGAAQSNLYFWRSSTNAAAYFGSRGTRGFFKNMAFDPTIVNVRNAQVGMSALAGGETQFHVGSATGTSIGAMAGGLDLAFIAGLINKLDGAF